MNVMVLYTVPPDRVGPGRDVGEFDVSEAARAVAAAYPGAEPVGVRGTAAEVLRLLDDRRPDVVFNLCEAPLGRPDREAHAASLFEWCGVRFTGSGSETLALCRRKDLTRAVLAAAGVPIPDGDGFPRIVKPADEDGSAGIDETSVCADPAAVARARASIPGSVVVEEFLPGTEFVVSLWGRTDPDHLSVGEMRFSNGLRLNTYASKWDVDSADFRNATLHYDTGIDSGLRSAVEAVAARAWRATGIRGYARIDVRLDGAGAPRVIDVNPNPEMSPGVGIHRAVVESGWGWDRFVREQIEWA
jgi:D-alanine-D-alanine ligase